MTIDATFTTFPELTTERLRLREVLMPDAAALYAMLRDEETMRFYGSEPYPSLGETQAFIRQRLAEYAERKSVRWGITLKEDDTIIGSCGFRSFDEGLHRAEMGYILNRAHWGKGLMTEALSAILAYAFTDMGLHRVEAIIDIANERSKNVLLRLGFQYEGNLRQRFVTRNGFEDEHYFGLLRDEWTAGLGERAR